MIRSSAMGAMTLGMMYGSVTVTSLISCVELRSFSIRQRGSKFNRSTVAEDVQLGRSELARESRVTYGELQSRELTPNELVAFPSQLPWQTPRVHGPLVGGLPRPFRTASSGRRAHHLQCARGASGAVLACSESAFSCLLVYPISHVVTPRRGRNPVRT